ncbi:hypothetical protein, partial [Actinomadura sp. BRA 177]|uniref:hypothetical protein n=1 Tax=Actinomadura sp. BRA 177 TaxID=2745202 RepID=UPI001595E78A
GWSSRCSARRRDRARLLGGQRAEHRDDQPVALPAAGVLRAAGWRVLAVRSAADLARAWTTAGKAGEDFVRDGS